MYEAPKSQVTGAEVCMKEVCRHIFLHTLQVLDTGIGLKLCTANY